VRDQHDTSDRRDHAEEVHVHPQRRLHVLRVPPDVDHLQEAEQAQEADDFGQLREPPALRPLVVRREVPAGYRCQGADGYRRYHVESEPCGQVTCDDARAISDKSIFKIDGIHLNKVEADIQEKYRVDGVVGDLNRGHEAVRHETRKSLKQAERT
jgi:hypothetical protein